MTTTNTLFKSETVFGMCLECDTRVDTHFDLSPLKDFGTRFIACPNCGKGAIEVITKPSSLSMFEWGLGCVERSLNLYTNLLNSSLDTLKQFEEDKDCKWYQKTLVEQAEYQASVTKFKTKLEMIQQLINTVKGENQ